MHNKHVISPAQGKRLMLVYAVLDGSAGMFIKLLLWNPFVIAGLRSLIASILLYIYFTNRGIKIAVTWKSLAAGCMISAVFITFIAATGMTASANAVALQYCSPAFVIVLSLLLFRQKPARRELLTVFGVLIGIALVFAGTGISGKTGGNVLALFSGMCLAGMLLFNNRVKDPAEHYGALVLGHATTFLVSVYFIYSYPPELNIESIAAIAALGVLQQVVPNILYACAIRVCKPLTCSLIMMLQLVINPLLVFLAVGEIPATLEIAGCSVILCVSVWALVSSTKEKGTV